MILYFDKYGTFIKKDDEGELWIQGDNLANKIKVYFYNEKYGSITSDTTFINLYKYNVDIVLKRADNNASPDLIMTKIDGNNGAQITADNWMTEVQGELSATVRLKENGVIKAMGIAYIQIAQGLIPSDTTITDSEKNALEESLLSKEDKANKVSFVSKNNPSEVLYPNEKAVSDMYNALHNEIIDNSNDVSNLKETVKTNEKRINNIENELSDNLDIINTFADEVNEFRKDNQDIKNKINTLGTSAYKDVGTSVGNVPLIGANGKLDKNILPLQDVSVDARNALIYGGVLYLQNNIPYFEPSKQLIERYPTLDKEPYELTENTDIESAYFTIINAGSEGVTILGLTDLYNGDNVIVNGANSFQKWDNHDEVGTIVILKRW